MADDVEKIYCDHVVDGDRIVPRMFVPIGERRVVILCYGCSERVIGHVLSDIVTRAVSSGFTAAFENKEST